MDEEKRCEFDAAALLTANLGKMHHQQSISHTIRTWSFAFLGFLVGTAFLTSSTLVVSSTAFVVAEIVLFIILLRDLSWHGMFWRYRDRARACEECILGKVSTRECIERYNAAEDRTRINLLKSALTPKSVFGIAHHCCPVISRRAPIG
jgi:hypothetical protein